MPNPTSTRPMVWGATSERPPWSAIVCSYFQSSVRPTQVHNDVMIWKGFSHYRHFMIVTGHRKSKKCTIRFIILEPLLISHLISFHLSTYHGARPSVLNYVVWAMNKIPKSDATLKKSKSAVGFIPGDGLVMSATSGTPLPLELSGRRGIAVAWVCPSVRPSVNFTLSAW